MDQLGHVVVLMSANHGDSAPSHKTLCCVHVEVQKDNKFALDQMTELLNVYNFFFFFFSRRHSAVISCISQLVANKLQPR